MNIIEKFQEEVRKNQKLMKKWLYDCEAELNSLKFLFRKLKMPNLYKEKSVYIGCSSDEFGELFPIFKNHIGQRRIGGVQVNEKQFRGFERCFSIPSGAPIVYSDNAEETCYTMDTIYELLPDFEKEVESNKSNYLAIQNIMACFDKGRIKSPVHNIINLLLVLQITPLTIEEKCKVLGAVVYFNNKHIKINSDEEICFSREIQILAEYYNSEGSFVYNNDIETFRQQLANLKSIYEELENLMYFISVKFAKCSEPLMDIEGMVSLLIQNNNHKEKAPKENSKQDENAKNEARKEVEKYLVNGQILSLPNNLNEFFSLLDCCGFDDNEVSNIKSSVKKEILRANNLSIVPYLCKEEKVVFSSAWTILQMPQESGIICNSIMEIFESLQMVAEMLEDPENIDEKEYLNNEKSELLGKLESIINRKNKIDEKTNNNLIFIKGDSSLPIVVDDINQLGENYHKIVSFLIRKINADNKNNFVRHSINGEFKYPVYEVSNSKAHVMFVEIVNGVYVIVGAAGFGMGYEKLTDRTLTLEPYFDLLHDSLLEENNRNTILAGNSSFTNFFGNTDLTRRRDI